MEYHLTREIRLINETENPNLHNWYLQEFTQDGNSASSKLIPWAWGFHFTASNLQYVTSINLKNSKEKQHPIVSSESIQIKLQPQGSELLDVQSAPQFFMLGTDREIKDFSLTISCLQSDEEEEYCTAMGVVSYTSEIDFRYHTTDDWLGFEIGLTPKNFQNLRRLSQHKSSNDSLWLNIQGSGFYSEWSPTISTYNVKVLTQGNGHKVIQSNEQIELPSLGNISKFSLSLARKETLQPWSVNQDSALENQKESASTKSETGFVQGNQDSMLSTRVKHLQLALANMQKALWLIAALLLLSLIIR